MAAIRVAVEAAAKRTFAVALDWPGWARSGKTEDEALSNLAAYAPRYAAAVGEPNLAGASEFEVVERLTGGSSTEFGIPGAPAEADDRPLDDAELERQERLLRAAWAAFDRAAAEAEGHELRTGPRGGGRNLDKMRNHLLEGEESYLAMLGSRPPRDGGSIGQRLAAVHAASLVTLRARIGGEPLPNPRATRKPWAPRYFVRRSAWHALDHAWEIEDRVSG